MSDGNFSHSLNFSFITSMDTIVPLFIRTVIYLYFLNVSDLTNFYSVKCRLPCCIHINYCFRCWLVSAPESIDFLYSLHKFYSVMHPTIYPSVTIVCFPEIDSLARPFFLHDTFCQYLLPPYSLDLYWYFCFYPWFNWPGFSLLALRGQTGIDSISVCFSVNCNSSQISITIL